MDQKPIRFEMRLHPKLSRQIDDWRRHQTDLPSKSEAARRLIEIGLNVADETLPADQSQSH